MAVVDTPSTSTIALFVFNIGNVSTNPLNMNGVAIVTPFPASMSDTEAMTRCRIAIACSYSLDDFDLSEGSDGHTCLPNSVAIRIFFWVGVMLLAFVESSDFVVVSSSLLFVMVAAEAEVVALFDDHRLFENSYFL